MRVPRLLLALVLFALLAFALHPRAHAQSASPQKPTVYRIKYISNDAVYIDAGRNADLQEGMRLTVVNPPPDNVISDGIRFRGYPVVAELRVSSLADSSAVCDIVHADSELKVGQFAFLSPDSAENRHQSQTARDAENYPIVVAFSDGDPLDTEIRDAKVTRVVESPVVGSMRGRFGFSYGGINESGLNSSQLGMMIDADMNHIAGTWWNFNGYWRGNLTTSSSNLPGGGTATLTDLINRTYHLGFTYQNPYSPNTFGIGRLYLPWAPSLSTIDGGYYGRRIGRITTAGVFAGSTPDPSSWSYNPNQRIAGAFVSFEDGDFDHLHFISTAGVAVNSIEWRVSRQFVFLENNLNWKRFVSFYNSMQIDAARTSPYEGGGSNPTGVSQSYTSLHFQPSSFIGFGINHNFFRQLPTFDPTLIGTGLLDKYLFQGFSGDVRFDFPHGVGVYAALGKSKTSSDTQSSLNQSYGITLANLWRTGLLFDVHYSKFDSDFGSGQYTSFSLSRNVTETLRLQFLGGHQRFDSPLTTNSNATFFNGVADWTIKRRYFVEGLFGYYRGTTMNYNQWSTMLGYRFGGLRR